MLTFSSFDVDTHDCQILFGFVGTDGAVQLFSKTSTTRSWKMLFRPSWAVLCSWSGIETVPYCLGSGLSEACLILILDILRTVAGQVPLFTTVVAAPSFSTVLTIERIISTLANVGVQLFLELGNCIQIHGFWHS